MGQEQMTSDPERIKIFSYYAQSDLLLYLELEQHLRSLSCGPVEIWDTRYIPLSGKIVEETDKHFNSASVILLLISIAFLNDHRCQQIWQRAIVRYGDEPDKVRVIPILVGPASMPSELAGLQGLPRDGRPLSSLTRPQREGAWVNIVSEICRVIEGMQSPPSPSSPPSGPLPAPTRSDPLPSPKPPPRPTVLMVFIMLGVILVVGVSLLIGFAKNFNATDTQKTPTSSPTNTAHSTSSPTSMAHPVPAWTTTITTGATGVKGDSHVSSPVVVNGTVYVGSYDGSLYAFNANTGKKLWASPSTGNFITSTPVVVNGIVYVGSWDDKLHAFDATTGAVRWTSMPTGNSIYSSSVVDNGTVYVGSQDDKLYAFNATTGATRWISSPTGDSIESSPAVADGVVYVGSWDHKLYAFDAGSGKLLWFSAPTGNMIKSSPAVANGSSMLAQMMESSMLIG